MAKKKAEYKTVLGALRNLKRLPLSERLKREHAIRFFTAQEFTEWLLSRPASTLFRKITYSSKEIDFMIKVVGTSKDRDVVQTFKELLDGSQDGGETQFSNKQEEELDDMIRRFGRAQYTSSTGVG